MLSTTLRRVLVASGIVVATSFMASASAFATGASDSSEAGFSGTVSTACTVSSQFTNPSATKLAYNTTPYSGSGGISKLSASQSASFDCNSDTVTVSTGVALTQPTDPTNALLLKGVHTTTITNGNDAAQTKSADGAGAPLAGLAAANWKTNNQGNITVTLKSEWNPQTNGEELLHGDYTAVATLTVTAN